MTETNTNQSTELYEDLKEIKRRGHSQRNFTPEEFADLYDEIERAEELADLREALKRIDDGRWHKALDELHNVFGHYDLEGRREFSEAHPEMMKWITVWGMCEDMAKYRKWSGL